MVALALVVWHVPAWPQAFLVLAQLLPGPSWATGQALWKRNPVQLLHSREGQCASHGQTICAQKAPCVVYVSMCAGPAGAPGSSLPTTPRDWLLPCVALGQADDQSLFELCLRLKYTGDTRIPLAALVELHGGMLQDLPVEAVVKKHDLLVGGGHTQAYMCIFSWDMRCKKTCGDSLHTRASI